MTNGDLADLIREVIVDSFTTIANVLIEAGDELTAKDAGERFLDPTNVLELQCALVARFDQVVKEMGDA